ncbi:RidA family protein [Mesorhizobium sp. B2-5-13]|uniref:RidA family protein n=1 Tax=unclassified Mesorhizobium TaxID=325217 RepID=UPI00112C924C|nr:MULTISPECIES: RidA family protein [unclassified Mesorhizobium]TPJ83369.1 RidA family protein [Mesorhizobium sp. B2-5-13]TPK44470.1 RidA family protein [Mesorhizobium sp. B2-5-5]
MSYLEQLRALGLDLLPVPTPSGNFRNVIRIGKLVYVSGQGPREVDGYLHCGKVGRDVLTQDAYQHAHLVGLNILSVLADALGDLGRVGRVVKLQGFVNADSDFTEHPAVVNGCSDLFIGVFGDNGHHARSAVGVASLPNNITVEIEAIFELRH